MQPQAHLNLPAQSDIDGASFPLRENLLAHGQVLIPGIIGGLGPLPHIFFECTLVKQARQRGLASEQEYPLWILMNAAPTPDRTKALLAGNNACVGPLTSAGFSLASAGADFLVSICNTSHAFHSGVSRNLKVPWLNMLQVVSMDIKEMRSRPRKVGLLATDGTIKTGIFETAFRQCGLDDIEVLKPSAILQKRVMEAIYDPFMGIKTGGSLQVGSETHGKILEVSEELIAAGADLIITGCTELSLGAEELKLSGMPIIDPLSLLAKIVLKVSFGEEDVYKYSSWRHA